MTKADRDGAAILEFQQAMLEDESLSQPAFDAIGEGARRKRGVERRRAEQVAGYLASSDDYFRARSADLIDIRERVLRLLSAAPTAVAPTGAVLFGRDLTPTQFLATNWAEGGGIILSEGSPASHVAMLARARGVPMVVGIGGIAAANDDFVLVDAEQGVSSSCPTQERHEFLRASTAQSAALLLRRRSTVGKPAVSADGAPIEVFVNIAEPSDVEHVAIANCDGVGLMRTEFLFANGLPDEDTQYAAYRRVLEWAGSKPVTIRTIDAGGDKPVPGFTIEESNPFLGLRGIRLSLQRPEVFRVQIRALLRAAAHGNLKVMFPMVSIRAELAARKALFAEEAAALGHCRVPPLGIMVEVPAVAIHPEPFKDAAFFSIGSNDLTQYVMAAGRDSSAVAALGDVRNPAVLSLIRAVARFGHDNGIPVSLCGEAGGDPHAIGDLLHAGLRSLSVSPAQLALAKATISRAYAHG